MPEMAEHHAGWSSNHQPAHAPGGLEAAAAIAIMTPAHIAGVMAIEQSAFAAPWTRELLCQELAAPGGLRYVAIRTRPQRGDIAGYICGMLVLDECSIHKIACHPGCRRRGMGGMLLRYFMQQAMGRGARLFMLEVRESNVAARQFYHSFGFVQTGRRRGYYSDAHEDALVLHYRAADPVGGAPAADIISG